MQFQPPLILQQAWKFLKNNNKRASIVDIKAINDVGEPWTMIEN